MAELEARINETMFASTYADVFNGNPTWNAVKVPGGRPLRLPRGLDLHPGAAVLPGPDPEVRPPRDIMSARILALLGDSVTTDHISPRATSRRTARPGST